TWRRRLQRQHRRPQRLLLEPGPELRAARHGQKGINDSGVEGACPSVPRKLDGCLVTTKLIDSLEKARREHDARRDGDCLAAAPARSATVPLFEYRQQRVLDCLRHAQPLGEALRDLTRVTKTFAHKFA